METDKSNKNNATFEYKCEFWTGRKIIEFEFHYILAALNAYFAYYHTSIIEIFLWESLAVIYALNLFIEHSGEHWWEQNIFCSFTTPQAFWQSSAPAALSALVVSFVLYSLTWATLMSPGKDETRVCGCIYIYIHKWLLCWVCLY